MKIIITTLLPLVLFTTAARSYAQEVITVEQLLTAGDSENRAFAAATYITGWKEGTALQMMSLAQDFRASGDPAGEEYAARVQALGDCLMLLGVADLAAGLNASIRENMISPETPARSALRVVVEGICPGPITRGSPPQPGDGSALYIDGANQPWMIAIDNCMRAGGSRNDCIVSLPSELLAELEAWEAENGAMRRRQIQQGNRNTEAGECVFGVQCR